LDKLEIRLNPDHDIENYKRVYAEDGLIRIQNLFPTETAEAIHKVLLEQTPWHMVHSDAEGKHQYYSPDQWNRIPNQERMKRLGETFGRAKDGFAYNYLFYPMIRAYLESRDPAWPLHAMTEYLNSEDMLNFVKTITGNPQSRKLDGQATFYARGHFLNAHDDTGHNAERQAAYVMGFSKDWRVDWGGHLLFLKDGDVEKGFVPSFNTMTLFRVPRDHIVTQVTNFAGAGRYSITGWLRDDA